MFKHECKKIVLSISFIFFVIVIFLNFFTQMGDVLSERIEKPQPDWEDFGSVVREVPEVMMPQAISSLVDEYYRGYYVTYPIMTYKEKQLKAKENEKMEKIIEKLTGMSMAELNELTNEMNEKNQQQLNQLLARLEEENIPEEMALCDYVPESYEPAANLSYEEFKDLMDQADDLLGGESSYSESNRLQKFSQVPMTYEEALKDYELTFESGKLGLAYTRLMCDYTGIMIPLVGVFAVAFYWSQDKRRKVQDVIYTRSISSLKLVVTRTGTLLALMAPIVLIPTIILYASVNPLYPETNINWLAAFGETCLWLLPETLFTIAFGALVTELTSPYIAIVLQEAFWFFCLLNTKLVGDIKKIDLVIRHNSLGDMGIFNLSYKTFVWNRVFYLIISLVMLALLVLVYEGKRRGVLKDGFKNFEFGRKES